jgi:hypothetical protein
MNRKTNRQQLICALDTLVIACMMLRRSRPLPVAATPAADN